MLFSWNKILLPNKISFRANINFFYFPEKCFRDHKRAVIAVLYLKQIEPSTPLSRGDRIRPRDAAADPHFLQTEACGRKTFPVAARESIPVVGKAFSHFRTQIRKPPSPIPWPSGLARAVIGRNWWAHESFSSGYASGYSLHRSLGVSCVVPWTPLIARLWLLCRSRFDKPWTGPNIGAREASLGFPDACQQMAKLHLWPSSGKLAWLMWW